MDGIARMIGDSGTFPESIPSEMNMCPESFFKIDVIDCTNCSCEFLVRRTKTTKSNRL